MIHDGRKWFLSGRFIGENVNLIYGILLEGKMRNIPGMVLSTDLEKAFAMISWNFIDKV